MKKIKIIICALWLLFTPILVSARDVTPQDLVFLYRSIFSYRLDIDQFNTIEYYQTPRQFLINKAGDCEDAAIFYDYILKNQGYWCQMYATFSEESGHAFLIYKSNNQYFILDQGYISLFGFNTPLEAVKYHIPDWLEIYKFKPIKYGEIKALDSKLSLTLIESRKKAEW